MSFKRPLPTRFLAASLSVAFFAATAILQPGLFGTLALYILAGAILLIGTSFILVIKFRADQVHDQFVRRPGGAEQLLQ
jgi:hypothetical protein